MKPTQQYVKEKFREYNQQMFAGKLPEIPVELSNAKGFIGVCKYRKREAEDGSIELYDFRLSINTRLDLPEDEIQDTIIHEMIHYFIGYNKLEDSSSHGPMFQHLMKSINEKYGRHITISHKGTKEDAEQAIDKRAKWHVIAVITYFGGRKGIKVLPRVIERILDYRKGVQTAQGVESIDFYLCNDPFFNRFPTSAALNVYEVALDDLNAHLAAAKELIVSDNKVIVPE